MYKKLSVPVSDYHELTMETLIDTRVLVSLAKRRQRLTLSDKSVTVGQLTCSCADISSVTLEGGTIVLGTGVETIKLSVESPLLRGLADLKLTGLLGTLLVSFHTGDYARSRAIAGAFRRIRRVCRILLLLLVLLVPLTGLGVALRAQSGSSGLGVFALAVLLGLLLVQAQIWYINCEAERFRSL